MDLVLKTLLGVAVLIAVLFSVYYVFQHSFTQSVTKAQAISLVTHDLQNTYPNAVVNITNVTTSQFSGSWHITAALVLNGTTPCPSYYIYSFDYPKYGFVSRLDNNYTANCVVNGLSGNSSYVISSYPVAIARSYSLNVPNVMGFVNRYGYNYVSVKAVHYNATIFSYRNYTRVWLVNYSAPGVNYSAYVLLNQVGGTLATAANQSH